MAIGPVPDFTDADALEAWAKDQPIAIYYPARKVIIALRDHRNSDHPLMTKFLAADVEKLKSAIEAARG